MATLTRLTEREAAPHCEMRLFQLGANDPRVRRNISSTARNAYLRRLDAFVPSLLTHQPFTVISLFCGGGGLDLGLGFAGFRTLVVSDIAPTCVETVAANLPGVRPLVSDAFALSAEKLLDEAGVGHVDLVAAGPPCQSFSILGRRAALGDPRGMLALKYFELVADIRPRVFLFENVPGLLTVNHGADWNRVLEFAAKTTGYHVHWARLNAVSFGIPQYRERVFLVGLRKPSGFRFPEGPTGTGAKELLDAVADCGFQATPSAWALEAVDSLPNHVVRDHGPDVRARYLGIPPGGRDRTDHTDRIRPWTPAGTVLVGSAAGGGRPHIHPFEPRVITVREAARLQSFPDWYVFHGTATSQYRQVGNAVPPLLSWEVGKSIAQTLEGS